MLQSTTNNPLTPPSGGRGVPGFFLSTYLPLARRAGEAFGLNPVVILAQSALETGWGQSTLCREYNNFFGITAAGKGNDYWDGTGVQLRPGSLRFRRYLSPAHSFMDYARLIRTRYPQAAAVSFRPEAFALAISDSKYISEVNGDDRQAYRRALVSICRKITEQ